MGRITEIIIKWCNKRMCTVTEFDRAVKEMQATIDMDNDGFISVKEAIKCIGQILIKCRTKR